MLGMKNHFDISGSIEIREVDTAGVACIYFTPDGIRTRNCPVCRQVIYPLDYRIVRFFLAYILC